MKIAARLFVAVFVALVTFLTLDPARGAESDREAIRDRRLFEAVQNGWPEILREVLKEGADPNKKDVIGNTPLLLAGYGYKSRLAIVRTLLDAGAELNVQDREGRTALAIAASRADTELLRFLLERGADPNIRDQYGRSPLMHAISGSPAEKQLEAARLLLAAGADIDAKDRDGRGAATYAASSGRLDTLIFLIESGAKVEEKIALQALLCDAAKRGSVKEIRELLAKGADPNVRELKAMSRSIIAGALFNAARSGSEEAVRILLEAGADPNESPALYEAIRRGNLTMVKLMFKHGADTKPKNIEQHTPLMTAASQKGRDSLEIIRALVTAGADLNVIEKRGHTAAMFAAMSGSTEAVLFLLDAGTTVLVKETLGEALRMAALRGSVTETRQLLGRKADVNTKPWGLFEGTIRLDGDTALIGAVRGGHLDVAKVLLEAGANPDIQGHKGQNALMAALWLRRIDIVELLVKHNADPNIKDDAGYTVLMYAVQGTVGAQFGRTSIPLLLAAGADINAKDPNGRTGAVIAASSGNIELVALLRQAGANIEQNKALQEALHHAALRAELKEIHDLLSRGADVNARDNDGKTALLIASERGRTDIVKALLSAGADVNIRDKSGMSPLMQSAKNGYSEIVDMLLSEGADANARANDGRTALMEAVEKFGKRNIVEKLLAAGADANARTAIGETPLMIAGRRNEWGIAMMLLAKGADVNAKDQDGLTALMYAAIQGHLRLVDLLISNGADVNAKASYAITALQIATGDWVIRRLREAGAK